jgi:hypothetical protein
MSLRIGGALATLIGMAVLGPAHAEPYLAVQNGYKCNVCHVNPTGGGLRNDFGVLFAKLLLPADTLEDAASAWTGKVADSVRVGGDLRADWQRNTVPNSANQQQFALQQFRLYSDVSVIPNRLGIYVDEQVAPNAAETMEAYVRYGNAGDGWYLKGGKFYLPFGWRLQDQTAFVREATGISMTTPDQGLELGFEKSAWSAQIDLTNGSANAGTGSGYQVTDQVVYTRPRWRLGAATSITASHAGNRHVFGLFAGFRTGPVAWLGEADLIDDQSFPGGRRLVSGLAEIDWRLARGHNLKLTDEYYDPNRGVADDQQTRWSVLYEFTPLPFLQLRAGLRRYRGIPQNDLENRRITFVELHGFF